MADVLLNKYDIYYNDGSSKLGFMLAKDKKGAKMWRRDDERPLPDSFATGDIAYANLSPDVQKIIAHRYFHGGLGALEFEVEDDADFQILRYLRSTNIDCRCKGKAYPGPKIVSVTLPVAGAPTIVNADFETDVSPTAGFGWTAGDGTWARSGTYKKEDNYSWHNSSGLVNEEIKQKLAGWIKGVEYTAKVWGTSDTIGADFRITMHDGIDMTNGDSVNVDAAGTFYEAEVPKTLAMTATKCELYCETNSANKIYFDEATIVATAITNGVTASDAVFNGGYYKNFGKVLAKLNAAGTAFEVVAVMPYTITDLCAIPWSGTDYLFIALGAANKYYYLGAATSSATLSEDLDASETGVDTSDGTQFAEGNTIKIDSEEMQVVSIATNTLTVGRGYLGTTAATHDSGATIIIYTLTLGTIGTAGTADKFAKVGTDLWQLVLPNKIRKAVNPLNGGSWGSEITVGEAAYNVNDILAHDGYLYCMKEEGAFYEDGAGAIVQPFPELETLLDDDSGKNSNVFRAGLYFRMGNQQLWEIKDGVLTEVTPELSSRGISQYAYEIVAVISDESWLYAIINRGSGDLAVLSGRWEYISGLSRFIWHEIRTIDQTTVVTAFVGSTEGRPYLYLGSGTSTETVYKLYLPVTNDATSDSGYRFYTNSTSVLGSLYSPRYMSLLFSVTKKWDELFTRSLSLSATNNFKPYYSTDDGVSFTQLGSIQLSPEQTKEFTDIEATMMNLRFDFICDSETVPPVLKYYNLKALTDMDSVVRFRHTVRCASGLRLKDNHIATEDYTATTIRAFIDGMRDEFCTLGDRWGTEHSVRVRITSEVEVFDEGTQKPETIFEIEAVVV